MEKYYGNYRGLVVDNQDVYVMSDNNTSKTLKFSRCKIYVEGVYPPEYKDRPDLLPWAEAVMPLFGGNGAAKPQSDSDKKKGFSRSYANESTGVITTPHIGSWVWVFFEMGNIMYPQYFGAVQAGSNYFAEHENQHIIATDNVIIKIDENTSHPDSTSRTDSNNQNCTESSQMPGMIKTNMPVLTDIVITNKNDNNDLCAINLTINGNVNMRINGNEYKEINGNVFVTHNGNLFYKMTGDIEYEQTGSIIRRIYGNEQSKYMPSDKNETGNCVITLSGGLGIRAQKNITIEAGGDYIVNSHNTIMHSANAIKDVAKQLITHN